MTRHDTVDMEGHRWARIGVGALHGQRSIGFRMLYSLQWSHQPELGSFSPVGSIYLLDAKPYSDGFIQSLAALWHVEVPSHMAPITAAAAYGIYGGHPEPEREPADDRMRRAFVQALATGSKG